MTFKQILIAAVCCTGLLAVSVSASDMVIQHTDYEAGIEIQYTEDTDIETAFALELSMESVILDSDVNMPNYHSDYGYTSLADENKGEEKQAFYRQLDAAAVLFHNDYTIDADPANQNIVTGLNYADLGLSSTEALEVWNIYRNDHPLYYWISNSVLYNKNSLFLRTDDLYNEGSEREKCCERIHEKIREFLALTEGETSSYRIAMAYHDAIIAAIDYAYKANGSPEDALWAHNIMGMFTERGSVCEGYSRTFQLLLNLSGVENIFVTGSANGGRHAWNLVQLDDGEWYWCDLTWDDCPDWMWGVKYNYFCVNDNENLNWSDGGWSLADEVNFMDQHRADTPAASSVYHLYPLPERAADPYTAVSDELLLRDVFTDGQFTCAVAGYNAVQVIKVNCTEKDLVIPETAEHNGTAYDIISIGGMDEDGLFTDSGLEWSGKSPETVGISKNMKFIWDFSFKFLSDVRAYSVSKDNPYFTSDDGVLFTKSKYTLIQYPSACREDEYEIPDETRNLAFYSFFNCAYLEEVTLGDNVEGLGIPNWGNGYPDNEFSGGTNVIAGGFGRLYDALAGKKSIEVDDDNPNYKEIDGIIYAPFDNGTVSLMFASKNIEKADIPKNVVSIGESAFADCTNLKEIVLPNPIRYIGSGAFSGCTSLETVVLPDSTNTLHNNLFEGCIRLAKIHIPNGVEEIQYAAFANCLSLETVILPESVTDIENYAFAFCRKLTDVYFWGDIPAVWNAAAFSGVSSNVTIHYLAGNNSGWTTPTWTAPDGITYNTEPFEAKDLAVSGDVDGDGCVTESDALLLKQYFAGYKISVNAEAADIDKDGQLTRRDAMFLARAIAGWTGYTLPSAGT